MSKEVNNRVWMKDFTSNKIKMIAERDFIQKKSHRKLIEEIYLINDSEE